MSEFDREIPQRELRNDVSAVLDEVAAGARIRVTVRGKPVADLVPVEPGRTFVPVTEVLALIAAAPLDARFLDEVTRAADQKVDEL